MTIQDAAHILNLQPNRGSVHRRIRQLLEQRGEKAGPLMQDGILTPQAERAVRQATEAMEARGERQPSATRAEEVAGVADYARLQSQLDTTRQELARVTQYLDDMDVFTGELVREFEAMQERLCRLEQEKRSERRTGPLEALVRMPQVFYSSVLRRQTG